MCTALYSVMPMLLAQQNGAALPGALLLWAIAVIVGVIVTSSDPAAIGY